MRILIVEDESLVAAEVEFIVAEAGLEVVGIESDAAGAAAAIARERPDVVLLDVHLADGPTGVEVAGGAVAGGAAVLFMTANRRRLPPDFAGAVGAVSKPYTEWGMRAALRYVVESIRDGGSRRSPPSSLELAPAWAERWRAHSADQSAQ